MMKLRLDEALVARRLSPSRSRARDSIARGCVRVNAEAARKPAQMVASTDNLQLDDGASNYVSRSALKLVHALDHFKLSPDGKYCLDIGASTGGFTQVLLERGAAHVVALDVGHGQLAGDIADHPRVTNLEGHNARDLVAGQFARPPQFIVADVSFISLKLALPPAMELADPAAVMIALIKPQFEVGKENLGKGGIVRNSALHQTVCDEITRFLESANWKVLGILPSPIQGGDGNQEFLVAATKQKERP
jgi:23S rRNA (cytidine1920-2'-O)/16S rRNA (cytidine1409-2'-O)-methyltransferase